MGYVERQVPQGTEVFLDHVSWFLSDLDVAARVLGRLGFQVSGVNVQYDANERGELAPTGTSNRLVLLERGFLEFLVATGETPLADQLYKAAARYAGLHLIAMTHPDMAVQRARLLSAGFAMLPTVHMRRPVRTPEGDREVAYTILRTEPGQMAEGRVQMLTAHTPELLWRPGTMTHDNAAQALTDLLVCVTDPAEAVPRYERYTGRTARQAGACEAIEFERGRIMIAGLAGAQAMVPGFAAPSLPYSAGVALRSADLSATRDALARGGVKPMLGTGDLICVRPTDALGAYLLFHAASVETPWQALRAAQR